MDSKFAMKHVCVNCNLLEKAGWVLVNKISGGSKQMKQIEENPIVALVGEWFTADGKGYEF